MNDAAVSSPRNASSGNVAVDLAAQQRLDVAVGVADEVLRALELDGQPLAIAPVLVGERAGETGDGLREGIAFSGHSGFLAQ